MGADVTLKRNDVKPIVTHTCVDAGGVAVNLTGASVVFVMRALTATAPTVQAAGAIVSPAAGTVSYTWTVNDTKVAGAFQAAFVVTFGDATVQTFPGDGYLEILIEEDLITAGGARLVTLFEVKDHLRLPAGDRSHDARLQRMIDGAAPVVESITGPILQRIVQDETYDGGSWFIQLRRSPVIEVHEVTEYRGPIPYRLAQVPTPDLGTIYSYMFEPPGRIVRRTVGGGITPFPPGADQVFVTYTCGLPKPPANVVEGTLELIRLNFQPTQQGGRPRTGAGTPDDELGQLMMGFYVPKRVKELLAPDAIGPSVA